MKFKFSLRNIIFIIIIIICIGALNFGVYWTFFRDIPKTNTVGEEPEIDNTNNEELEKMAKNFDSIFTNSLDYQNYKINTTGLTKKNVNEDLIYTLYKKEETVDNKYSININIPYINISNTAVEKINSEIDSIFVEKARDILQNATNNTIYNVEYMSYINTNILSIVIKSTLKEGNNPQRVIIQTYNYNLSTNDVMNLRQILEAKGIQEDKITSGVKEKIQQANKQAEEMKKLGYNVYIRTLNSSMYTIENTETYFVGQNGRLYIIYPYGNTNFTSETDVIVF